MKVMKRCIALLETVSGGRQALGPLVATTLLPWYGGPHRIISTTDVPRTEQSR